VSPTTWADDTVSRFAGVRYGQQHHGAETFAYWGTRARRAACLAHSHELVDDFAGKERGARRTYLTAVAGLVVATTLAGVSMVGCSTNSTSPTATSRSATSTATSHGSSSTSAQAQPTDYARLLIQVSDINAPEVFTASPPEINPNAFATVATTFRNQDGTHVIYDSILIAPDPAAAARALESRKALAPQGTVHGAPVPIDIGTGGTTIAGPSPDGSKGVTVLLFTEGKAFAELEFDGPPNVLVPPDFVTDVGQKQDAAIKNGLAG
jgi:hypothetical protein